MIVVFDSMGRKAHNQPDFTSDKYRVKVYFKYSSKSSGKARSVFPEDALERLFSQLSFYVEAFIVLSSNNI